MDDEQTIYLVEPDESILSIDYEQQGDQWLDALASALKERFPTYNGYSLHAKQASADFRYPHREFTINEIQGVTGVPIDTPSLKIAQGMSDDTKVLYVVLSSKKPITDIDKLKWTESIKVATASLENENPEFEWSAVLGQINDINTPTISLRKKTSIQQLVVRSGRKPYTNYLDNVTPYFSSSRPNQSWPIVIEGKSTGYDWQSASRQAGQYTYRAAALVSIAWDATWFLLNSPQPTKPGSMNIPEVGMFGTPHSPVFRTKTLKSLPKWTNKAWDIIESSEEIGDAVNAYYQGLGLFEEHPSFSLIAFIASIETIGKKIIGRKCECCNKETSSNQRFRAGVDEVVADKRKAKLFYELYTSRSGTAHEGKLHGNEEVMGISFPSIFKSDSKDTFIYSDLRNVRIVCRLLLIKTLKDKVVFKY